MKGIIFIIISICLVFIGMMIQIKSLKKRHPNAELLIGLMHILGFKQPTYSEENISNGKN